MTPSRRQWIRAGLGGLTAGALGACKGTLGMNPSSQPNRASIDALFDRPKLMCFGRYAVELPREAEQVIGFQAIAGGFKQEPVSKFRDPEDLLEANWRHTLQEDAKSEMLPGIMNGPVPSAKHLWFYDGDFGKRHGLRMLDGVIRVGPFLYVYQGMTTRRPAVSADTLFANMTALMRGMRAWDGVEVPREPGVCIDGAFIHEPTNRFQEIMSSGFYFPSLPDVSFSVMSNKNAATDGPNGVGLLERVDRARSRANSIPLLGGYPYSFLRRGKRTLHGLWDGEEVLTRSSNDQALRFEWAMVGERGNVARPAHLSIALRTRVRDNRVGASPETSISDEQAVALWDRLLDNVKFRVAVPGATPQAVALR